MRWATLLALAVACGGGGGDDQPTADTGTTGDDTLLVDTAVDTSPPVGSLTTFCDEQPVTTWENFGAGFMTQHCQSCHASGAQERNGAPDGVVFDTEDDVVAFGERVLVRVVDDGSMPPQGGPTDDERYLVDVWLSCGLAE